MKYSIKITYPSGKVAYLCHKDKTAFCKRTAQKYLQEWVYLHGHKAEIVQANQLSNGEW